MNSAPERKIWQEPWSYPESFAIAIGLIITGFLLEAMSDTIISLPEWPYNALLGAFLIVILFTINFMYRKYPIVRFFSGPEASIGAISMYALLVLFMGFIQQDELNLLPLGLSHIRNSWPFLLSSLYLLNILGLVVLRRIFSKKKNKLVFLINHFGLWLVIFSAGLGSSDLQRYHMNVNEGEYVTLGYNNKHENIKFPFELKLIDFNIDEFPARLVWVDYQTYQIGSNFKNTASLIEEGAIFKTKDYNITVESYVPKAMKISNENYIASDDSFAGQAALIAVMDKDGNVIRKGWVSSGSPAFQSSYLPVDSNYFLAMTLPEPKRFSSKIEIKDSKGTIITTRIEVNKPLKVDGWQLYQYGYDTEKGRYSKLSIIEAVKDPWIPIVYTGLFMLIAGSLLLFYKGRN